MLPVPGSIYANAQYKWKKKCLNKVALCFGKMLSQMFMSVYLLFFLPFFKINFTVHKSSFKDFTNSLVMSEINENVRLPLNTSRKDGR